MIREATNEINSYSVAAHIAAEVFGSLRTVLSLNAINFEQKRFDILFVSIEIYYSDCCN